MTNQQMCTKQESSQQAAKALRTFSHDLKNQLHVIAGYVEILQMTTTDEGQKKYLVKIEDSVEKSKEVLNALSKR